MLWCVNTGVSSSNSQKEPLTVLFLKTVVQDPGHRGSLTSVSWWIYFGLNY